MNQPAFLDAMVPASSAVGRRAMSVASLWRALRATVWEWRRRMRSRRELADLPHFDLKDIGYPAEAAAEKSKPFWRA
ncbi:MAG TPA: DUF1127 domain-containing protein [Xanthobacteraceae bacterium]|nr:DUF1127 domain-containing protein [Xanthobacteraceae bacterium]